jgi:hypothetical protein
MDADSGFIDLGVLPCTLDAGIAARAAIGLLVLATDQTMEHEFRHLIRLPGVAVYGARLFNDADITPDTLRAIGDRIAPATELILPSMHLDVVAFGCTSASMTLGEAEVVKRHVDLRDKATRRFTNPVRYCDGPTGHSLVRLKEAIPPSRPGSTVGAARRCGP